MNVDKVGSSNSLTHHSRIGKLAFVFCFQIRLTVRHLNNGNQHLFRGGLLDGAFTYYLLATRQTNMDVTGQGVDSADDNITITTMTPTICSSHIPTFHEYIMSKFATPRDVSSMKMSGQLKRILFNLYNKPPCDIESRVYCDAFGLVSQLTRT